MALTAITTETPKNLLLGAGTIHKNLKFSAGDWNYNESLIGATSGGAKLTITPTITDVDVDGASVKVKGLTFKMGETATLEVNMIELNDETIKMGIIGTKGTSANEGWDVIESKPNIEAGDYLENIAFRGLKSDGTPIVIVLDNALCTSGLPLEAKKGEASVMAFTFECYADIEDDQTILPYHIYTPAKTEE